MLSNDDRRKLAAASILARRRAARLGPAARLRARQVEIEHATAAGEENGLWSLAERPEATAADVAVLQRATDDALAIAVAKAIADPAVPVQHARVLAWLLGSRAGLLAGGPMVSRPSELQRLGEVAADRRDAAAAAEGAAA